MGLGAPGMPQPRGSGALVCGGEPLGDVFRGEGGRAPFRLPSPFPVGGPDG